METPAVVFAIIIAKWNHAESANKWEVLKKALTDGTLLLLIGSIIVGYLLMLMGNDTGMLVFFLL